MLNQPVWAAAGEGLPERLRASWGWLVAFGTLLVLVGFAAIGAPVVATFTTVTLFGILLLVGSAVEIGSVVWVRRWRTFVHHLLSGLLYLFLGLVLVERPGLGAAGYTLVLAVFFVASGAARVAHAVGDRAPGRGWTIFSGVVSVLLGVMIWRDLPESALWVIGTFVGIELVFNGMTCLMVGMAVPNLPGPAELRPPDQMARV